LIYFINYNKIIYSLKRGEKQMIADFTKIVQDDIQLLVHTIKGNWPNREDDRKKIYFASARMFATLGMGLSTIGGLITIKKATSSVAGAIFIAAMSVALG
jgi:hypothetical protein